MNSMAGPYRQRSEPTRRPGRPGNQGANPKYRNPLSKIQLGAQKAQRESGDLLNPSPEKAVPSINQRGEPLPEISPRRAQLKAANTLVAKMPEAGAGADIGRGGKKKAREVQDRTFDQVQASAQLLQEITMKDAANDQGNGDDAEEANEEDMPENEQLDDDNNLSNAVMRKRSKQNESTTRKRTSLKRVSLPATAPEASTSKASRASERLRKSAPESSTAPASSKRGRGRPRTSASNASSTGFAGDEDIGAENPKSTDTTANETQGRLPQNVKRKSGGRKRRAEEDEGEDEDDAATTRAAKRGRRQSAVNEKSASRKRSTEEQEDEDEHGDGAGTSRTAKRTRGQNTAEKAPERRATRGSTKATEEASKAAQTAKTSREKAGRKKGTARSNSKKGLAPRVEHISIGEVVFPSTHGEDEEEVEDASAEEGDDDEGGDAPEAEAEAEVDESESAVASEEEASDHETTDTAPVEAPNPLANAERLCGQWDRLQKIYKALDDVGVEVRHGQREDQDLPELEDNDIKELRWHCRRLAKAFRELKVSPDNPDPPEELEEVLDKVRDLWRGPDGIKDATKITNVYSHLIPRLVRLLRTIIECYSVIDQGKAPRGQLTLFHMKIVTRVVASIFGIGMAVKQSKIAPHGRGPLVKPTHNGITVPMRNLVGEFSLYIASRETELRREKETRETAEALALRLQEVESQREAEAEHRAGKMEWARMHEERIRWEGPRTADKWKYLSHPIYEPELDYNGDPFHREEGLRPRDGPSPNRIWEARQRKWTLAELEALQTGLQQFEGENVYVDIFRKYCRHGGLLNRFNVTDIVVKAADLKDWLGTTKFALEPWLKDLHVWVSERDYAGQENLDRGAIVVDDNV